MVILSPVDGGVRRWGNVCSLANTLQGTTFVARKASGE